MLPVPSVMKVFRQDLEVRARLALALESGAEPALSLGVLEKTPWSRGLKDLALAQRSHACRQVADARSRATTAAVALDDAGLACHALGARAYAAKLGGEHAGTYLDEARSRGAQAPERFLALLVPGLLYC